MTIVKVVNTPAAISNLLFVFTILKMMLGHFGGDVVGVMDHNRSMDQNWDKDTRVRTRS